MKNAPKFLIAALALTLTVTGCRTKRPDKNITPIPGVNVGAINPDESTGIVDDNSTGTGAGQSGNELDNGGLAGQPVGPGSGTMLTTTPGIAPIEPPPVGPGGYEQSGNIDDLTNMLRDETAFAANTIYFDFDSSVVRSSEIVKLDEVIQILLTDGSLKLIVEGHCDSRGTEEYNRALGERRANSVREHLITAGIGADRVRTISFGEDKPKDFGQDEAAWAANRRGEFILLRPRN